MNNFIEHLENALLQPLPGNAAHREMLATPSNGQRFQFKHHGEANQGGVAVIFYQNQGEWHLPLMKRPHYQGIHSGQISLPGGKREPADEDLIHTAIRETEEEIGLLLTRKQIIGQLSPLYISASHYQVQPIVLWCPEPPQFKTDPREVAALIEVPLKDLIDPNLKKVTQIAVRGTDITAPFFDLEAEVVWGATAMMLNELIRVIRDFGVPTNQKSNPHL